ncbi:MAG: ATP-binding protein [Holdemanella sp.]|nr:ATP-binding protein [Holdemanella sp.]
MKEQLNVNPSMESMVEVLSFIEDLLEKEEVTIKQSHKISVVVDELYSNIINYSKATQAIVICEINKDVISITFKDNGIPYNPFKKADPDVHQSIEEREIGGLGIFLTKKLMDDCTYLSEENMNVVKVSLFRK